MKRRRTSMTTLVVCLVCLGASVVPFAADDTDPEKTKSRSDERTAWVHSTGYFLKGMGSDWFESLNKGRQRPHQFTEVFACDEYIELRRTVNPVTVRLYKDQSYLSEPSRGSDFVKLYEGKWHTTE